MKICFNTSALAPMLDWLSERKKTGEGDEALLREILCLPDYRVEFERYSEPNLPVCGISFEEAVDFFMHFDSKDFENQRLQYKKPSFAAFYNDLESRAARVNELDVYKRQRLYRPLRLRVPRAARKTQA